MSTVDTDEEAEETLHDKLDELRTRVIDSYKKSSKSDSWTHPKGRLWINCWQSIRHRLLPRLNSYLEKNSDGSPVDFLEAIKKEHALKKPYAKQKSVNWYELCLGVLEEDPDGLLRDIYLMAKEEIGRTDESQEIAPEAKV